MTNGRGAEELQPAGPLLAEAFEAALLVVGFLPASGVAHQPEAAGAVDLQAGLDAAEERLAGSERFQEAAYGRFDLIFSDLRVRRRVPISSQRSLFDLKEGYG